MGRLQAYAELLLKWQRRINLVGSSTLPDLWRRHMLDSAQLFPLLPPGPVLDVGSGAGFPGLVLAILRAGAGQPGQVHLIEADSRKSAFLREAARVTETPVDIHNHRIEAVAPFAAAVVTARAVASLGQLLDLAEPFLGAASQCLFLKGRTGEDELTQAAKDWKMTAERIPSLTDPSGFIIHLREVHRGRDA